MKTTLKSTLIALSFTIVAAFAFSGCESTGGSGNGTHVMGLPKAGTVMADRSMPDHRMGGSNATTQSMPGRNKP